VRRRNLVPADQMPYATPLKTRGNMQVVLDSGDYPRCQAMALEAAGWNDFPARRAAARTRGRRLGMGLANSVEGTGRGPYEQVRVCVAPNGKVNVYSGATAMGQSTRTMLSQIVAEQLGGDMDNIVVTAGDSDAVPFSFGGFNSRQAVMAGSSAHKAAQTVREKLLTVAAKVLNADAATLRIEGSSVIDAAGKIADFAQLARAAAGVAGFYLPASTPGIEASEQVIIDDMAYANASAVVEVEVDEETGEVTMRNVVFAHDCGTVIHPQIVEGQILGGIAHGIGNALFEWMGFDDNAQPVTTNLAEYLLITATEMPPIKLLHLESPSPLNALGIKGVGEAGVLPMAAAIASAIDNALDDYGIHITNVPVSPMDLLAKIETARALRLHVQCVAVV
jgi:carbon-monoxide dehydrogenase large subunit